MQSRQDGPRAETGPMRFGDDHPGIFFRGDDALGIAGRLRMIAEAIRQGDPVVTAAAPMCFDELAHRLEACRIP